MSAPILRQYQTNLIDSTFTAWEQSNQNVLIQSHTGSGKTVMLTEIVRRANVPTVIIAHRLELVSQLSLALARAEILHSFVSPPEAISSIIKLHLQTGDRHYFSPTAQVLVASVDTLVRRDPQWASRVKLVVIDEAAHVLRKNKWGKALGMFPNARGLLVTATPLRADGRGLGREGEGIADVLIEGPSMRQLISEGYLSEYRIFAPPNALDVSHVNITASGDYSPDPLRQAVSKAHITGDIVEHFKRLGGNLGITFAVSVEAAHELVAAYEEAGVPAVCIHANTGISERAAIMRQFREGTIRQLVNVDILAEGVDVPAVSCVSMARPTASYGLYMQQIGRALRPSEGKTHAIILDHVGNVMKHGLPDVPRAWTLESQDRKARGKTGGIPLRTCLNAMCVAVFERNRDRCPYCGHPVPLPKLRATPAQVEGNLRELETPALDALTKEIARIEGAPHVPRNVSGIVGASIVKKHHARQDAQRVLRDVIAEWAGVWHAAGESDTEILRRFWFQFGIDTLTAQTLPTSKAIDLIDKISPGHEFVKKNEIVEDDEKPSPDTDLIGALTDEDIEKVVLKKRSSGRSSCLLNDSDCLSMIITPNSKSWRFTYRLNGTKTSMGLGKYPGVSILEARKLRNLAKKLVLDKIDPKKHFDFSEKNKLTQSTIKKLKPKNTKYSVPDGEGLTLTVTEKNKKYWVFTYYLNGERKSISFGKYKPVSLEEARSIRGLASDCLGKGIEPTMYNDANRDGALDVEEIEQAPSKDKPYSLPDGRRLYLMVTPNTGKYWSVGYKLDGINKSLVLGEYPQLSLSEARKLRDEIKEIVKAGNDPFSKYNVARRKKTPLKLVDSHGT